MQRNHKQRIELRMSLADSAAALAEGNPGAVGALLALMKSGPAADPDSVLPGLSPWLDLDRLGIYGPNIYVLYADVCQRNAVRLLALLRANQLGLLPEATLLEASRRQDYSAAQVVNVLREYQRVRQRLPKFDALNHANYSAEDLSIPF